MTPRIRADLRRAIQKAFEPGDVRYDGVRVEMHEVSIREDRSTSGNTRWFKLSPERSQRLAQTIATRTRLAIGPEELDQHFSGMRAPAMVGEVGEQQCRLAGLKTRDRTESGSAGGRVLRYPQSAEEIDTPSHRDQFRKFGVRSSGSMPAKQSSRHHGGRVGWSVQNGARGFASSSE